MLQSAATGGSPDRDERVHAMHFQFQRYFPFPNGIVHDRCRSASETARRRSFYDVGVDKVRVVDIPTKLLSRHSVRRENSGKLDTLIRQMNRRG